MRYWRPIVPLVAVLVWVVAVPLAMASDNCMAMGALCAGPCGAIPCVASEHVDVSELTPVSEDVTPSIEHAVATALRVAEPPPRLSAFSA